MSADTDAEEASKGCATITIIMFVILLMVAVWWLGYRAGYGDGYMRGVVEFKELKINSVKEAIHEERQAV